MNIEPYLRRMAKVGASDMFFTTGAPPSVKVDGKMQAMSKSILKPGSVAKIAKAVMNDEQRAIFDEEFEMNLGMSIADLGRFRVNIYLQRGEVSMVIRYIDSNIPDVEALNLPGVLNDLVMLNTGLILLVGSTGSGKSTTLAAMLNFRNNNVANHILTVEDPIEFTYTHGKSIVGQREVGIDTKTYQRALREAMREAPDVILIGEIRDRETMESALSFADTGHLVLSSLHAVNSNQALDRIINFFPPEARNHILMDLSMNLRSIVSQRLLVDVDGKRIPAVEVLINSTYVSELIRKGEFSEIKEVMTKSTDEGVQTFDGALFELYAEGRIDRETALSNADSRTNLEWQMNFGKSNDVNPDLSSDDIVGSTDDDDSVHSPPTEEQDKENLLESLTNDDSFDQDDESEGFLDDLLDFDDTRVDSENSG